MRVLIRVPYLPTDSTLPLRHTASVLPPGAASANETTTAARPGSTSFELLSTDDRTTDRRRGAAQHLRLDAAHGETPSPHSAPLTWLGNRTNLLGGLLERRSLLAIGLIVAAVVTAALLVTSRSQPAVSHAAHQPDGHAKEPNLAAGKKDVSTTNIIPDSLPPVPPTAPEQSSSPPTYWNVPAAANLPASISDSAARTAARPIELARREMAPSPIVTDLQPAAGQSGVATFSGVIDKTPSPSQ